jgi:hypothetical protein
MLARQLRRAEKKKIMKQKIIPAAPRATHQANEKSNRQQLYYY